MDETVLYDLSYGLYVVGATKENMPEGCLVNTVFQITAFPPAVAVSINNDNYTCACIKNTREFSVSILTEQTSPKVIGTFGFKSGKDTDKFDGIPYHTISGGLPVLSEHVSGWLHCKVDNMVDVGTHTIFVATVADTGHGTKDESPMTYAYYYDVIKGKAPENAPTYRKEPKKEMKEEEKKGRDYVCTVCGYVYRGGDFEDLPDSWTCPICSVGKDKFRPKE